KGLKINEYGVFKKTKKKLIRIGGQTELEMYRSINLPYIPPEIREDEGEIEAAKKRKLPKLINLKNIRGDLQMHTRWSDGRNNILEMAQAAKEKGYEYIAITDHASPMVVTNGLDAKKINNYIKAIKRADEKIKGIKILAGIEVDILANGKLYLSDNILKKLDLVLGSIHSGFRTPKDTMTQRVIRAMENPYLHILAHPTGRLINKREPIELNMEEIMKVAKKTGTILEINASWVRLDLKDIHARMAKERGVKIVISTDAHNTKGLNLMQFGIMTARRGWLEKKDVINTQPLKKFLKYLKTNK
ncbi:PHP domain-containing protein, partial [Patescibacteria group bacterium]|nr:PHP domain-containing protein [Patescibacteria group bacterium]